jgi:PAS domain S-box-containing protein
VQTATLGTKRFRGCAVNHFPLARPLIGPSSYGPAKYGLDLLIIGAACFALNKISLILTSTDLNALPISATAGVALAAMLLRGLRVWPAIFLGLLFANAWTGSADASLADSALSAAMAAAAYTVAAVLAGYLINLISDGRRTFDTPTGIAKFALIGALGTLTGALVGAGSLGLIGYTPWSGIGINAAAWWLRDMAGTIVIAPVIVLWAASGARKLTLDDVMASGAAFTGVAAVGLVAFSPLFEQSALRNALGFLAVLPLLWAALRCSQKDTATASLILLCFVMWGTMAGSGPFAEPGLNGAYVPLTVFMLSATVMSLALAAEIGLRNGFERRLRYREYNLRSMFNQTGVGVALTDTSGRFILVNPQFCSIVDRSQAELLKMRVQDLADPDELHQFLTPLGQAVQSGKGFVLESSHASIDGTRFWLRNHASAICDSHGITRHLMFVVEDITPRRHDEDDTQNLLYDLKRTMGENAAALKTAGHALHAEIEQRKLVEAELKHDIAERNKAQEALMESERRFRLFIQGVTDYAIFMLDPNGNITNWNTGAQRIYQYADSQVIGEHFSKFYSEEEQQRGEPARALQVAAYEGKYVTERQYLRRDRSLFWASVVIEAIRDEAGGLVGFAKTTRDISERREAQASLERAQEQLAQSQKMEALGQLTGSIAHDFNNLLMIVSGHAQLLRRRLTDPKQLRAVSAMHSAANRGESLTRQLLAFSRRQPLNPVVADLKERIEAVHEMLVGSLRGNVQLECDISPDVWPVEVDIAELELAMVNIAVNARDAMPGGGTIALSTRNVTLGKNDRIDSLEGDFIALAMTDSGVGIAPDVLPRIFEPFFTTKALGKGTGLGLSQVYGFSRQSGGTVVVASKVGIGTTITLYLPRKHAALVATAESPSLQPFVPGEGTILVVEDNAEVADVTTSMVEQLGYRTLRVENATDALNLLQRGTNIDLVLSDIVMPGSMNGIALAQEIGSRYSWIPVLLTSGYSDVVQTVASQLPILRKPFQLPALEKFIREALDRRVGQDHARQDDDGRVVQFPRASAGR